MKLKGVIGIVCTPYNPDMTMDYESLRNQVEFILHSGAHGISFPIMASEFNAISDDERKKALDIVIDITKGHLPVYAGITGFNIHQSLALADHAQKAGADCLVCMTPLLHSFDEARTFEFFHILDDRVSVPVILQNMEGFGATPLSVRSTVKLISECKNVKYLKEESPPSILKMGMAITSGIGIVEGVFGGWGGLQLMDELELGSSGSLIACEFVDIVAKAYDAWAEGRQEEAESIFHRVLPALVYETKMIHAFWLTVLQKRGIIKHNRCRSLSLALTENMLRQIDRYLEDLKDLMIDNKA
jgi:2-keto-3-deoxy-L-arabinonate dehydratase